MEYREFRAESVSVDGEGKLHGVAVPFNTQTTIGDLDRGGWREEVAPGACKKSIQEGDVVFLAHHDMHKPLARMSAGNLEFRDGPDKLHWSADPVDTSYGRDIRALAKAKVLGGVSIGFLPVKDEWRDADGNPSDRINGTHRVLREVKLIEISAVTNPAYKDTSIMARDELLAERETRAAKAAYADLETCGDCGATGQYGAYCSNCGESMASPKQAAGKFCTSCGSKVDGKRSHDCDLEARAAKPYGNVKYADPKNGKYPIDTEEHIRAALSYINMPKNAAKYPLNGVKLSTVKAAIEAAAKEIGIKVEGKSEDAPSSPDEYSDEFYINEAADAEEGRDDPDGKEYEAIDAALRQLKAGDVKGATKTLAANQVQRAQEPDSSTPEDEDQEALKRQADALRLSAANWDFDEPQVN